MDGLDIHTLRVFLEAARALSFTEAGRVLNLTQPAVSMQIRGLEDYLRVKLFERNPQGIQLTRAGHALVPRAQQIISLVISTEESLRVEIAQVSGDMVIGSSATAGKYILPPVVAHFRRLHPNVNVTIPIDSRRMMMESVVSGEYDLGVTSLRAPDFDVDYSDLVIDRLSLIAPASHPWARRASIEAHELYSEQFICREPESACRNIVSAGLNQLGLDMTDLDMVMEVGSAEALAMAVENGIGLSFVSLLAAMPRVALGRLALVQVQGLELQNAVELVSSRNRAASPAAAKFREFLEQPQIRVQMQSLAAGQML